MDTNEDKTEGYSIGQDLYGVSVNELETFIDMLKQEVIRLEAECERKLKDRVVAEGLFGKPK